MKYIKLFESRIFKYELGDYVIPVGNNPKDSYSIVEEVRGGFYDYMVASYNIYSGKQVERFPVVENEIIRKLTPEEIKNITMWLQVKKYNL